MAYTEVTLANDAYELLKARVPHAPPSLIPRLVTMIPAALERLGRLAKKGYYEGLQRAFSLAISSGEFDLASIPGLLFDPLFSVVYAKALSPTEPAIFLLTPEDLVWGDMALGASEPIYYSQKGTILVFRNNTDGLLTTLGNHGTVVTNYVPSLTDATRPLPAHYEGLLLETLVELATGDGLKPIESAMIGRA